MEAVHYNRPVDRLWDMGRQNIAEDIAMTQIAPHIGKQVVPEPLVVLGLQVELGVPVAFVHIEASEGIVAVVGRDKESADTERDMGLGHLMLEPWGSLTECYSMLIYSQVHKRLGKLRDRSD